jgi:molybdenum cofactor cytidylyltransferase
MRNVALILLAAGGSRRLGEPKQLLPFKGRSLLRHAAETALRTSCRPVVVVLGTEAQRMKSELSDLEVEIVENREWQEGVASSIRAGLRAVGDVDGYVMMLCDQPFITPEFIDALARCERLASAEYGGSIGVPAFFPREYFPELNALQGDQGDEFLARKRSST